MCKSKLSSRVSIHTGFLPVENLGNKIFFSLENHEFCDNCKVIMSSQIKYLPSISIGLANLEGGKEYLIGEFSQTETETNI